MSREFYQAPYYDIRTGWFRSKIGSAQVIVESGVPLEDLTCSLYEDALTMMMLKGDYVEHESYGLHHVYTNFDQDFFPYLIKDGHVKTAYLPSACIMGYSSMPGIEDFFSIYFQCNKFYSKILGVNYYGEGWQEFIQFYLKIIDRV